MARKMVCKNQQNFCHEMPLMLILKLTEAKLKPWLLLNRPHNGIIQKSSSSLDIKVDGATVVQVSHFTYLGAVISANGTQDKDLDSRIGKASGAINFFAPVWYGV